MNGFVGVLIGAGIVAASSSRKGREFASAMLAMAEEGIRARLTPKPASASKEKKESKDDA